MVKTHYVIGAVFFFMMLGASQSFAYKNDEDGISNLRQRSQERRNEYLRSLEPDIPTYDQNGRWTGYQKEDASGRVQQYGTGGQWKGSVGEKK